MVEEVCVTKLHKQPSLKDPARKSWEAILGSRYFDKSGIGHHVVIYVRHSTARAKKLGLCDIFTTVRKLR
jgi:hypothetical protein